jgi:hypothetical protein
VRSVLTKLGILASLLGTLALSATSPTLAKAKRTVTSVENFPYNYTCKASWFYPGYHCYQASSDYQYNAFPAYAYGSSYTCTAAVWNGWQWVRKQVC